MCAVLQTMKITQQLSPVYTTQAVVKPVQQPVKCLYTRYNQLSNRMSNRFFWQPVVSVTGQLADTPTRGFPTRGLVNSRTGQVTDWPTRSLSDAARRTKTKHSKSLVASASCPVCNLSSTRVIQSMSWQSVSWRIRKLSSYRCIVYTNIQPVVKPVGQPAVSCSQVRTWAKWSNWQRTKAWLCTCLSILVMWADDLGTSVTVFIIFTTIFG